MKFILFFLLLSAGTGSQASDRDEAKAAYASGDYVKAMAIYLPLAEAGEGAAQGDVGNMYAFGWGVPVDGEKAVAYWRLAADNHYGDPMGNIATYYMLGKGGLPKDEAEATKWYLKASEHGHVLSMVTLSAFYDLGINVKRDKQRALAWAMVALSGAKPETDQPFVNIQYKQAKRGATVADMQAARDLAASFIETINANRLLRRKGKL
jgi:TPR repeat protein